MLYKYKIAWKYELQELEPSYMDLNFPFAWCLNISRENKLSGQLLGAYKTCQYTKILFDKEQSKINECNL